MRVSCSKRTRRVFHALAVHAHGTLLDLPHGFARARHKESQRSLPAISLAAQEVVQVRDHAQAALDAMRGVFGQQHEEEPDTAKHGKLPPSDPDDQG